MDDKEKIISFIRLRGPSLPTAIAKQVESDSFFVSAHLSELKGLSRIKISYIKVGGGSPLYYLPGQESMLQNFVDNLGEKERRVYDLLKGKKILRDISLVPVFRAAVRSLKDFAFPFTVNFKDKKEIFWKWYLLSKEEAEKLVKGILGIKEEKPKEIQKKAEERKIEKTDEKKHIEKKAQEIKEEQTKLEKKHIEKKIETKKPIKDSGNFYGEVNEYFLQNRVKIIDEKRIRKTELEFVVELPSPVGNLKYFVKAKSKKKLNDGDLSSVFIQGQTKGLPVLFLAKGELTKKAAEMLETQFKGMKFKKI